MRRFWIACVLVGGVGAMAVGCGGTPSEDTDSTEGFVCGVDGKTYSVEEAARGDNEVRHRGRCGEPMHCDTPSDCFVGDQCMPGTGAPWCIPGPTRCNCPGVFEPVCGGDGRNYINACEAACAGVGVRHQGYCDEMCFDDSDCPPGHYCERAYPWSADGMDPDHPKPPPPGVCVDLCVLIDCAPGYICELGQCIPQTGVCNDDDDCPVGWICQEGILGSPQFEGVCERCGCPEIYAPVCGVDGKTYGNACEARCAHVEVAYEGECKDDCPVETHIRNFQGECVPKCYGPEQCPDGQRCNAAEVCQQDPACPECDVCVGWCVPPTADCRVTGCAPGWTCEHCQTADGQTEWICLPPNAGACLPPDECRPIGCNGEICASGEVASPCIELPEAVCYREVGICEVQPWGHCGWTPTPELDECLSKFDCRATGCGSGEYCGYCWTSWVCLPEGAVC